MKKRLIAAGCVVFWLAVWQVGAMLLDQKILLVSPIDAIKRLIELVPSAKFWQSVGFSSLRVLSGFFSGLSAGTVLALIAGKLRFVKTLLSPLFSVLKAIPVASFTILALIWVSSKNLSVLVSFLISVPIVYANMSEGLEALDPRLTEMAEVFDIPPGRRFVGVYLSQLLPYFRSAARLAIGLSWKSGAAAEVIGIPSGSIGEKLYQAKIYLETADLFAWTIVIILLSVLCERVIIALLRLLERRVCRAGFAVGGKNRSTALSPISITAENISKAYGGKPVLDGFSCEFEAGTTTAVMGASGCGKTTLMSVITGLVPKDGGRVLYDGGNFAGKPRFSVVFQEDRLCENLTVSANIRLVTGRRYSDAEISSELSALGLSGCGNKPVRELSGGMKRRAALLRALLAENNAIILDEPFKGLDETTKQTVTEHCRLKFSGRTVIMVTHDKTECEGLADRTLLLTDTAAPP